MASIIIIAGNLTWNETDIIVSGIAFVEGGFGPYDWSTMVNSTDLAATINNSIKNAAIAVAASNGHTIGGLDKKNLICGAVGL